MGRTLIEAVAAAPDLALCAALEVPGSPLVGQSATPSSMPALRITDDLCALDGADVLIDFTRPAGTLRHLQACQNAGVAIVIGTTGFSEAEKGQIQDAGRHVPIVFAPNMSVGVNVTLRLLEIAARTLAEGYDIEILEMHHRHKIDAPSGTALRMGEVIAGALGRELADCAVYSREGVTGERDPSTIGFAVLRGGDCVGEHTVVFAGTGERVEITHRATSRNTFSAGALRAARFLAGRAPGLYAMSDVLGLRTGG
ncbi:MAG: 4-hydroxy-tetrahydrodipicolinate reductase [Betaproteobacteria bacterium]|nr:4-hydroxy-tetrahydrodipicolinate reductase [Betaproteobacteria bacterium]